MFIPEMRRRKIDSFSFFIVLTQLAGAGGAQLVGSNKGSDEKSLILRCFPMTGRRDAVHLNSTEQKKKKKSCAPTEKGPDES